jgi:large subunit ribosomal protein L21
MYAVIQSGGKQYRVSPGQTVRVDKLQGDVGADVLLDSVLLYANNEDIKVGQPNLSDISVRGHIVEQGKAKKIIVFKMKRRKRYRRKQGHRQLYTAIRIDGIETSQDQIDGIETSQDQIDGTETSQDQIDGTETSQDQKE